MNIRKSLNESRIGKLVNGSVLGQVFERLIDGVSSYLKNYSVDVHKQAILDFMDDVERTAPRFQVREVYVVEQSQLPSELYDKPYVSEPIEQVINPSPDLYKIGELQTLETRI